MRAAIGDMPDTMMTVDSPDSPEFSFEHLLQVSSTLQALTDDVAVYSEDFGSDDTIPTWTVVNGRPSADMDHSEANDENSNIDDGEVWSGQERHLLFTFEHEMAFAHDLETGVYMKNAMSGSWCGRLRDDEDAKDVEIQNLVALNHVRRAREIASAQQRAAERQSVTSSTATTPGFNGPSTSHYDDYQDRKRREAMQKDKSLRTQIQLIKVMLRDNGVLTLQHTGAHDVDYNMNCKHPYCDSTDTCIAAHTYYLTLEVPGSAEFTCRYCIECFEGMWNGELQVGTFPDPRILKQGHMQEADQCVCHDGREDTADENKDDTFAGERCCDCGKAMVSLRQTSPLQLPTLRRTTEEIPASLLTSKHAPKPEEVEDSKVDDGQKGPKQRFEEPKPMLSAMRSTLQSSSDYDLSNDDCGRFSPTRFQHLAHHIQPGEGLNEKEKATLTVWKAITEEQFRCMSLSPFSGRTRKMDQLEALGSGASVVEAMDIVGKDRILFYGRDLSEALFFVGAR